MSDCPDIVKFYFKIRSEITVMDDMLFKGNKLIIPFGLRQEILRKLHYAHLGIKKCIDRANLSYYWPGMRKEITDMVLACYVCQRHQKSQPAEPLMPHVVRGRPWYKIGVDVYHFHNQSFLIAIDYYSRFVETSNLNKNLTSRNVIEKLQNIFSRFGIPNIVMSDNGGEFSSMEFANFSKNYDFKHVTSSPLFAQSNGKVEKAVQDVINILKKSLLSGNDPYLAMLEYRNTPIDGENSPANVFFNRDLRGILPVTEQRFKKTSFNKSKFNNFIKNSHVQQKRFFDRRAVQNPRNFRKNDLIWVQVTKKSVGTWFNFKKSCYSLIFGKTGQW